MKLFDLCVITASCPKQADTFQELIVRRQKHGLYPREFNIYVYADPVRGRVGNGGSTLLVLNRLVKDNNVQNPYDFFSRQRILIIHAGGESRRQPAFAPEGKIFMPVPLDSSSLFPPTILDSQLAFFLKYPWRRGEVLITSGDVVIDFDTYSLPDDRGHICGFASPADVKQGSKHGVFQFGEDGVIVNDYFQKYPTDFLAMYALIEGTDKCALDTGLLSLSPEAASAFVEIASLPTEQGSSILKQTKKGAINLNLYLELMTACIKRLSFQEFLHRVKPNSRLHTKTLNSFYKTFHRFELKAVVPPAGTFLHFGSLDDFHHVCVDFKKRNIRTFYTQNIEEISSPVNSEFIVCNSIHISSTAKIQKSVYIERSLDCEIKNAAGNNLLLGLQSWKSDMHLPEGICIDRRIVNDSTINMVYSIHDTFVPQKSLSSLVFCSVPFNQWLNERQLGISDLWKPKRSYDLMTAKLFIPNAPDELIEGYWRKQESCSWTDWFKSSKRLSIKEINDLDDARNRDEQRIEIRKKILQNLYQKHIGWKNISVQDFTLAFNEPNHVKTLLGFYDKTTDDLLRSYRKTLISTITNVKDEVTLYPLALSFESYSKHEPIQKIKVKDDQIVWARSPTRLDLAGGWSDTPPHTFRLGGKVVNISANLNEQPPIQVFCRKNNKGSIRLHSIDLGVSETISSFGALSNYKDPTSPFSLPKAALCLLGLSQFHYPHKSLDDVIAKIGSGIDITLLSAVPKGSGLGTSSILGATIIAALCEFFKLDFTKQDIISAVLELEQMLTTGGGWQDQVGGIIGGVKYIESKPGNTLDLVIQQLDDFLFTDMESLSCFTLFYTGITRLAKNILQDVVKRANENTPSYIFTLNYIKQLAVDAKNAISSRNLKELAEIVSHSWEANKRIHESATNEEIEYLFKKTRNYYIGVKLLGAGGGGYALFISRTPDQSKKLRSVLEEMRINKSARVTYLRLNTEGLLVSVS